MSDVLPDGLTAGEPAICGTCGMRILWRYNPSTGNTPPFNEERVACGSCTVDGRPTGKDALGLACPKCAGERYVYRSHYADCARPSRIKTGRMPRRRYGR